LVLWLWTWFRGVQLTIADGTLLPGLAAGALFAIEFLLIYEGLGFTAASRASVFLYTAPFFVVLGARWVLPAERFDAWQWLGLALSFLGVVIALGVPTPGAGKREFCRRSHAACGRRRMGRHDADRQSEPACARAEREGS